MFPSVPHFARTTTEDCQLGNYGWFLFLSYIVFIILIRFNDGARAYIYSY